MCDVGLPVPMKKYGMDCNFADHGQDECEFTPWGIRGEAEWEMSSDDDDLYDHTTGEGKSSHIIYSP